MTWTCQNCRTVIDEAGFEVCWHCGSARGQSLQGKAVEAKSAALRCLRCKTVMSRVGAKEFHEGSRWGVLGNLGELFVNKQALDMYACQSCGKVEFFLPEIHDQHSAN